MESYLMMLYVTLEQEAALKGFFISNGWIFSKPDLSVKTEELGPICCTSPERHLDNLAQAMGKRKAPTEVPSVAPQIKSARTLPCSSTAVRSVGETVWNESDALPAGSANLSQDIAQSSAANTVNIEDFGMENVKVKVEEVDYDSEDMENENELDDEYGREHEDYIYDEDIHYEERDSAYTDGLAAEEKMEAHADAVLDDSSFTMNPNPSQNSVKVEGDAAQYKPQKCGGQEKIDGTSFSSNPDDDVESLLSQCLYRDSYKCCICEKEIKVKYNMKRHLRTHLSDQINCSTCNKFFVSEEEKEEHMKTRHMVRHICETCGVSFKRKSDLNLHIVKHESDPVQEGKATVYKCTFKNCGKIFFRQANYDHHMNRHSGNKPFQCKYCTKLFHSKYVKNDHEKVCLQNGYKCDICNSMFKQRSGLHNHKHAEHDTFEEGYTCVVCSKSFKFSTGLIRHKRDKHLSTETSQQTESPEEATVMVQLNQGLTKAFEIATQTSNVAFNIVRDIATGEITSPSAVGSIIQTQVSESEVLPTNTSSIMATVTNPIPENSDLNVGRVVVVHHVTGSLPDQLQALDDSSITS